MGPATKRTVDDLPCYRAGVAMLRARRLPIPIKTGLKVPIGDDWGLVRYDEKTLRDVYMLHPGAGLGILLGADGGVIDIEVDDEDEGIPVLHRMFPDGVPDTLRFESNLGCHYLFAYDPRLAAYGQTIIKGFLEDGEVKGNPHYLGIEIRIGTIDPARPVQEQSIIPPTPRNDNQPRVWKQGENNVLYPEVVWEQARILPLPDSFFEDLDRHARPSVKVSAPKPTWNADEVKRAILPHAVALAKEWGLRITGSHANGEGWWECRSIDREDRTPSCGFNEKTGVYSDRGSGRDLGIFQLALALGAFQDFPDAVNSLGRRHRVHPSNGTFGGSGGSGGSTQKKSEQKPWGIPRLRNRVEAVPFPLEVLPVGLQTLCAEAARATQCPVDYFASVSVGLAGGVIGMSTTFAIKAHYRETAILYLAVVGPPGTKKTPAFKLLSLALWDIDRELRERYEAEKEEHQQRGDDAGPPPVLAQLTIDDTTREAVAQDLSVNRRGLVLIKDELTSWVAALDAYRAGKGDDKQFWLKVNSNAPVKVNRKGKSNEPLIVAHPFVTIVGGLTPAMLPTIKSSGDDGWIDRILFSYPEPQEAEDWSEDEVPQELLDDWTAAVRFLHSLAMVREENNRLRPYILGMTDQARDVWRAWVNRHRAETRDLDFFSSLKGPWSKLEGFCGRLALILTLLHHAYNPDHPGYLPEVDALNMAGATKLAEYFKAHFRRARVELTRQPDGMPPDDANAILKWVRHGGRSEFSVRDVKHNFERRFARNQVALEDALGWLERHDCIRGVELDQKVGRPHSEVYQVNPNLLGTEPQEE
jgi:hypothetical protein